MLIELITEDFKGSDYYNGADCPVARATRRVIAGGEQPYKLLITSFFDWNESIAIPLIEKANTGEEVTYSLNIPDL